MTPLEYLELEPELEVAQPPFCTWGAGATARSG